ncbi:MAG: hypothetical protein P4L31_01095 [Candidatus Babeliales bacterium]|nr:hypothetical protein [Candidatus Babeliales bacterium]
MYKSLLAVSLFSLSSFASQGQEIIKIKPFASHKLGSVDLYHADGRFHVMQNNKKYAIETHSVDEKIRSVDAHKMATFLKHGHIELKQTDQGDFKLRANVHGNGGGPVAGAVAYWVTKSICWGGVGAAAAGGVGVVVAATVATGGTAGVAVGAAVNAGASVAVGATLAGTTAAGAAAAAIGTSVAATEAATLLTAAAATAGGTAGLIGGIEATSAAAGALFLAMPFLP